MCSRSQAMSVLRTLYRELRPGVNEPHQHVYQTQLWQYVVSQCRQCKADPSSMEGQAKVLVRTGQYFIESIRGTREYVRLHEMYKGSGERTPRELAAILGFRMPDEPKVPRVPKK